MAALYLHSSGLGPRQWARTVAILGGEAPPLIGYGAAAWQGPSYAWTDECAALAPLLTPDTDLVGHSYGGFLALQLARRYPVRSVAVWEPVVLSVVDDRFRADELALDQPDDDVEAWLARFLRFWQVDWHAMSPAQQAPFLRHGRKVQAEVRALIHDKTPLAAYAEVVVPVLLLSGAETVPSSKQMCDRLAAALPNARHERVPNCGHMGPLTQRDALHDRLSRFWATLP